MNNTGKQVKLMSNNILEVDSLAELGIDMY